MKTLHWQSFNTVILTLILISHHNSVLGTVPTTSDATTPSFGTCNTSMSTNKDRNFIVGTNTAPIYGIVVGVFLTGDGNHSVVLNTSSSKFYLEQMNAVTWVVRVNTCLYSGETATLELSLSPDPDQICDRIPMMVTVQPTIPLFALSTESDHPLFGVYIRSCDPTTEVRVAYVMNAAWCIWFNCTVRCTNDEKRFWVTEAEPSKIMTDGRNIDTGKIYELEATCTEIRKDLQIEVHTVDRYMSVRFTSLVTCTRSTKESTSVMNTDAPTTVISSSVFVSPPSTISTNLVFSDSTSKALSTTSLQPASSDFSETLSFDVASSRTTPLTPVRTASKYTFTSTTLTSAVTTNTPSEESRNTALPTKFISQTNSVPETTSLLPAGVSLVTSQLTSDVSTDTVSPTVFISQITSMSEITSLLQTGVSLKTYSGGFQTIVSSTSNPGTASITTLPPADNDTQGTTDDLLNNPANVAAVATTGVVFAGVVVSVAARKLCSTMPVASRSSDSEEKSSSSDEAS